MNKRDINALLDKYYLGESELNEEKELRGEVLKDDDVFQKEQLIFEYYEEQADAPENLEEQIFANILEKEKQTKVIHKKWFRYSTIAAAVCLTATIFWFNTSQQPKGLSEDEQFAILEQALYNVSTGVKPAEDQDLLVLFQDDNLEIVMN